MRSLKILVFGFCFIFVSLFLFLSSKAPDLGFMPHGHCYYWLPHILYANIISDIITGVSYIAIPLIIVYVSYKSNGSLKAYKPFFFLFSAFILACGIGHLLYILETFYATYALSTVVKIITSILSLATAIACGIVFPTILKKLSKKHER